MSMGISALTGRKSVESNDVTIMCQGRDFIVYKDILCFRSPVFKASLEGKFQVISYIEAS
jgi:hypothetical protein